MTSNYLFCADCEDVKEKNQFCKCKVCREYPKNDDVEGSYFCSLHDSAYFKIDDGGIICEKCYGAKKNTKTPKINDEKQQMIEEILYDKIRYAEDRNKNMENEIKRYEKDIIRLDAESDVNTMLKTIRDLLNPNERDAIQIMNDSFSYRQELLKNIKVNKKNIDDNKIYLIAHKRALALYKENLKLTNE